MVQVAQHLLAARANVNFVGLTADSLHEGTGIGQRARTRGKTRHGVGFDISAWIVQQIHSTSCDNKGLRRIQPTRDTHHHLADAGTGEAFHQALDLDVVRFVTPAVAHCRVARHEWESVILTLTQQSFGLGEFQRKTDVPKLAYDVAVELYTLIKTRLAHALLGQALQVKIS